MPRAVILTNPASGKGRGVRRRDEALPQFRAAGWEVEAHHGLDADASLALAHEVVATRPDVLVMCGGDGMVNLGLQAAAGTDVPIGVLPAGTGNDFARCFGLPLRDGAAAARRIVHGRERSVDLARIGERWYGGVLAAGFDAVVNERANKMTWPRGQARYNLATLAELRVFEPLRYTLVLDGAERELDAMLVAIGNGPSFGGGLRIAHGAELDDGLLDVVLIKPVSRLELVRTFPKLYHGSHVNHPQYERHRVRKVTIASPGIVGYADGERFGPLPLSVECVAGAVRVRA
ncbi:diacylglycerol kinase [Nocardioides sp. zg-536]|uniref:Diacylglycerol kinase n=1 Tax=Nocardioides faecalis TaxID=2803858 RepID=A0A939BRX8_9ACTN|nr:diacylglycerol kinase [Nocardioides faecalis]MBM9459069.1 diacylglycerol kinase [Nocardioides faecalis]QVI57332.1 diacylglycerol kinase [Nocardioides faecalis]